MLLTVSHRTPSLLFHRFWFRFFVCVFQVQVIVKWELRDDQGNDLFCFSIPAVIVDWLYSNLFVKKMASNTYPLLQILKFVIILIPNFGRSSQIETLLNPNEYFATPNFHEWGQVKMDWKCRSYHPYALPLQTCLSVGESFPRAVCASSIRQFYKTTWDPNLDRRKKHILFGGR